MNEISFCFVNKPETESLTAMSFLYFKGKAI